MIDDRPCSNLDLKRVASWNALLRLDRENQRTGRGGLSILEVVVVISIVGLLVSLAGPAIQSAREEARTAQCDNHLRQTGLAFLSHEVDHGYFPTNGWGWNWVGDESRGFGSMQPGSWCFNILPYIDGESIRAQSIPPGASRRSQVAHSLTIPVAGLYCPSRRGAGTYPYTEDSFPLVNCDPVATAAKTDYAVCGGDKRIDTPKGPSDERPSTIAAFDWRYAAPANGVAFSINTVRHRDIMDGMSNTIFAGEKYLPIERYFDGLDRGDDQACFVGDDADNRRWAEQPPVRDAIGSGIQLFGSPHRACGFVYGDGSVHRIDYRIERGVFRSLGNRMDGR